MLAEKHKKAWEKFISTMVSLRKKRSEIFKRISEKSDQQKIEALREKLKNNE